MSGAPGERRKAIASAQSCFVSSTMRRAAACIERSLRFLRYEVRRWPDGVIADINEAVASPQRLTDDVFIAERLLELVSEVPTPVWGRNEISAGEMWNSNSLISWLIVRATLDVDTVQPPAGGLAPGWDAGVILARRQETAPGVRQPPLGGLNALARGIS